MTVTASAATAAPGTAQRPRVRRRITRRRAPSCASYSSLVSTPRRGPPFCNTRRRRGAPEAPPSASTALLVVLQPKLLPMLLSLLCTMSSSVQSVIGAAALTSIAPPRLSRRRGPFSSPSSYGCCVPARLPCPTATCLQRRDDCDMVQEDGRSEQRDVVNCGGNDRRMFLSTVLSSPFVGLTLPFYPPQSASARGLVRFPCVQPLGNTYHLLRTGQSELELQDVWITNPLFLTNRDSALSSVGEEQVLEACRKLKTADVTPTVVRYSLAANAVDGANLIGQQLNLGRDRLVPEFNFLDPRAIGKWDGATFGGVMGRKDVMDMVWALDVDEAGVDGTGARPPSNEDGTPHETLADQVVRLTNLMSVLETLYSGDTILLVFPDGTGPALLSALIGGVPLNRVHELEFQPGEVRLDVNLDSVKRTLPPSPPAEYNDVIQRGREKLRQVEEMEEKQHHAEEEEEANKLAQQREADEAEATKKEAERAARREKKEASRALEGGATGGMDLSAGLAAAAVVGVAGIAMVLSGGDESQMDEVNGIGESNGAINSTVSDAGLDYNSEEDTGGQVEPLIKQPREGNRGVVAYSEEEVPGVGSKIGMAEKTTDPSQQAKDAMKSYLDEDDGGEAWLGMMSELIAADEEETP